MNSKRTYIRDGRAPIPKKAVTSKIMSAIRSRNTKPELLLRRKLWQDGLRGYRLHWNKVPGRPDIAFPGKKIAIFVNGCFWHRCPHCNPSMPKSNIKFWKMKFDKNVKRDAVKLSLLKNQGWTTIIFWECQLKDNLKDSVNKVRQLLAKHAIKV